MVKISGGGIFKNPLRKGRKSDTASSTASNNNKPIVEEALEPTLSEDEDDEISIASFSLRPCTNSTRETSAFRTHMALHESIDSLFMNKEGGSTESFLLVNKAESSSEMVVVATAKETPKEKEEEETATPKVGVLDYLRKMEKVESVGTFRTETTMEDTDNNEEETNNLQQQQVGEEEEEAEDIEASGHCRLSAFKRQGSDNSMKTKNFDTTFALPKSPKVEASSNNKSPRSSKIKKIKRMESDLSLGAPPVSPRTPTSKKKKTKSKKKSMSVSESNDVEIDLPKTFRSLDTMATGPAQRANKAKKRKPKKRRSSVADDVTVTSQTDVKTRKQKKKKRSSSNSNARSLSSSERTDAEIQQQQQQRSTIGPSPPPTTTTAPTPLESNKKSIKRSSEPLEKPTLVLSTSDATEQSTESTITSTTANITTEQFEIKKRPSKRLSSGQSSPKDRLSELASTFPFLSASDGDGANKDTLPPPPLPPLPPTTPTTPKPKNIDLSGATGNYNKINKFPVLDASPSSTVNMRKSPQPEHAKLVLESPTTGRWTLEERRKRKEATLSKLVSKFNDYESKLEKEKKESSHSNNSSPFKIQLKQEMVEQMLQEKNNKNQELQSKVEQLEQQLLDRADETNQTKQKLQSHVEQLQQQLAHISLKETKRNEELEAQVEQLQLELLERRYGSERSERTENKNINNNGNSNNTEELEAKIFKLEKANKSLQEENLQHEEAIYNMRLAERDLKRKLLNGAKAQGELLMLRSRLKSQTSSYDGVSNELATVKQELNALQAEKGMEHLQQKVKDLENTKNALTAKVEQLQQELFKTKQELRAVTSSSATISTAATTPSSSPSWFPKSFSKNNLQETESTSSAKDTDILPARRSLSPLEQKLEGGSTGRGSWFSKSFRSVEGTASNIGSSSQSMTNTKDGDHKPWWSRPLKGCGDETSLIDDHKDALAEEPDCVRQESVDLIEIAALSSHHQRGLPF